MDPLREPISAVDARRCRWLPPGIGLEERELDWLRNMDDWMISKKRYYGLALPIWECDDCDAFEVIGSRDELRERARRGLGGVRRPLAAPAVDRRGRDRVRRVRRPRRGASPTSATRGSTPASCRSRRCSWNTDRAYWAASGSRPTSITEAFPGQFRNWFYALLRVAR